MAEGAQPGQPAQCLAPQVTPLTHQDAQWVSRAYETQAWQLSQTEALQVYEEHQGAQWSSVAESAQT